MQGHLNLQKFTRAEIKDEINQESGAIWSITSQTGGPASPPEIVSDKKETATEE